MTASLRLDGTPGRNTGIGLAAANRRPPRGGAVTATAGQGATRRMEAR